MRRHPTTMCKFCDDTIVTRRKGSVPICRACFRRLMKRIRAALKGELFVP
jgi:ribosomal protein L37AE/L43A